MLEGEDDEDRDIDGELDDREVIENVEEDVYEELLEADEDESRGLLDDELMSNGAADDEAELSATGEQAPSHSTPTVIGIEPSGWTKTSDTVMVDVKDPGGELLAEPPNDRVRVMVDVMLSAEHAAVLIAVAELAAIEAAPAGRLGGFLCPASGAKLSVKVARVLFERAPQTSKGLSAVSPMAHSRMSAVQFAQAASWAMEAPRSPGSNRSGRMLA